MAKEITIEVHTKLLDGWISDGIEYVLIEITVANNSPELYLFNSIEED
jgi:hypothetical protein